MPALLRLYDHAATEEPYGGTVLRSNRLQRGASLCDHAATKEDPTAGRPSLHWMLVPIRLRATLSLLRKTIRQALILSSVHPRRSVYVRQGVFASPYVSSASASFSLFLLHKKRNYASAYCDDDCWLGRRLS
jgi:hypothetical protein